VHATILGGSRCKEEISMSDERDSDIGEFDETNGLAPGLDGDSDGTNEDVDQKEHGVLGDFVEDITTGFKDRDSDYREGD
jgi:hypothetical protein